MLIPRQFHLRRKIELALLGVLSAVGWFLHPWLLQALANLVIADNSRSAAEYLVLYDEKASESYARCFDAAAAAYRANPQRRILLIEPRPHTLEKYGITPSFVILSRRELTARGVADSAIQEIGGAAPDDWRAARLLGKWLQDHPEREIEFYGARFHSRYQSCIVEQVLEPALAKRVYFCALPDPLYDETNWWKSRDGVKAFMFAHLSLIYARFHGETENDIPSWDPEEYARGLEPIGGKKLDLSRGIGDERLDHPIPIPYPKP